MHCIHCFNCMCGTFLCAKLCAQLYSALSLYFHRKCSEKHIVLARGGVRFLIFNSISIAGYLESGAAGLVAI